MIPNSKRRLNQRSSGEAPDEAPESRTDAKIIAVAVTKLFD
jgi:hypothetical protein